MKVNQIEFGAPWSWLGAGAKDFGKAFVPAILYGLVLMGVSLGLAFLLYSTGNLPWLLALAGGFLIVAPILATGLYSLSREIEAGRKPSVATLFKVPKRAVLQLGYLGVMLSVIYFMWARLAQVVYALFSHRTHHDIGAFTDFVINTPEGISMLVVGTVIGGLMAAFAFAISVVSAPMLLDRDTNIFTAMWASISSVKANPAPMWLWAVIIVVLTGIGLATLSVGLVFIFPWIGFATWHAYREAVPMELPTSGAPA